MASKALRRRLHLGDVDGRSHEHYEASHFDSLNEPLLGQHYEDDNEDEPKEVTSQDQWNDERRKEHLHWTLLFSKLIAQWVQWLRDMVLGSGSLIGRFLPLPFLSQNGPAKNFLSLSPLQEERLRILRQRVEIPFDGSLAEHQDALRQLWRLAYPERELPSLKSELWKDMGWQGSDPSTDFRGGGFISLENLIFFAQKYPESFQRLLHKRDGVRSEWEYPFAVAGINISFMLVQMLDLQSEKPSSLVGKRFLELLGEDEMAFENLYCITFQMLDALWLEKRATYMEFNEVLKSTRLQLERDLSVEDVLTIKDLPAYCLLKWDSFLSN